MIKEREREREAIVPPQIEPARGRRKRHRGQTLQAVSGIAWFIGTAALYLCTKTHRNTFDAVSYAGLIAIHRDAPGTSPAWMFHPHHLLFNALGYLLWKIAWIAGWHASSLDVLQTTNALLGAFGIALFFGTLSRLLPRAPWLAALMTAGLAGSFGYWICATDGRVNMPSTVLLLGAFALFVRLVERPSRGLAAAIGVLSGAAVLFHESAGLFGAVGFLGVVLAARTPAERERPAEKKKSRGWAELPVVYLATFVATIALPYLAIGYFVVGLHSVGSFRHWANSYAELGWWWNFHIASDLDQDLYAIRHALFVEPAGAGTIHLAPSVPLGLRAIYWTALGVWVATGCFVIGSMPRLLRSAQRPIVLVCILWAVLYAVFFTVWSPGYFVFWVPALIPLAILLALAVHSLPRRKHLPVTAALSGWLALCIAINWVCSIGPGMASDSSPFQRIALDMRAHTQPGDLVVVMGAGDDAQCEVDIPYFAERNLLSLHSTLTTAHEDVPLALARSREQIAHTLALHHQVYALDEVLEGKPQFDALHARHPEFTSSDLQSLVGAYRWRPAWQGPRGAVWQLAQTLASEPLQSPVNAR